MSIIIELAYKLVESCEQCKDRNSFSILVLATICMIRVFVTLQ